MNHKQILNKYIVERTNIKILESNLNIIADRFIKLNENAIRENRIDELVPLLAAPLWAAAKFAGGQLLRHGATRLASAAIKRGASQLGKRALSGASQLGQRALSGARKGWSMLRGTGGGVRTVGKEVAADTAADAGVQKIMPPKKEKPKNYLADLVASDKSNRGSNLSDDEMVESFLFEALESIFEEKKPGLFRRMISGAGRLGKGILGGFASGFMKGAFGAEPSKEGGFLSRVAKNYRNIKDKATRKQQAPINVANLEAKRAAKKAAKPLEPIDRSQRPILVGGTSHILPKGQTKFSDEQIKDLKASNRTLATVPETMPDDTQKKNVKSPEQVAAEERAKRFKKLKDMKNKTSTTPSEKPLGSNPYGESLITMGKKIVESMLMRIQEEDDDDDDDDNDDNIGSKERKEALGSKERKEALGSRKAGFYTKGSARTGAKPLLKKNKGGKAYKALLQNPEKQTSAIPLNPRRGQGRKGKRSSHPSNRPNSLRGRFVNTSRARTTDEEAAHQAALKSQKIERRKALVAKAIAMRNKR